jgi:hypothetical protein
MGGTVPYIPEHPDGSFVTYSGVVGGLTTTRTGGHVIVHVSGTDVFVPGGGSKFTLFQGDRVTLRGIVDTYAGKKRLSQTPL